jgi:hypothetical protein
MAMPLSGPYLKAVVAHPLAGRTLAGVKLSSFRKPMAIG